LDPYFHQSPHRLPHYRDFGKTSGHPAQLNIGDCFSYALAKAKGEPLLFKGQDFSRTAHGRNTTLRGAFNDSGELGRLLWLRSG
jgi:hypothetical protein